MSSATYLSRSSSRNCARNSTSKSETYSRYSSSSARVVSIAASIQTLDSAIVEHSRWRRLGLGLTLAAQRDNVAPLARLEVAQALQMAMRFSQNSLLLLFRVTSSPPVRSGEFAPPIRGHLCREGTQSWAMRRSISASISSWLSGRRRVVVMATVRFAIVITPLQSVCLYVIGRQRVEHVQPYFSTRESLSKGPEGE